MHSRKRLLKSAMMLKYGSQVETAKALGIPVPRLSRLVNGHQKNLLSSGHTRARLICSALPPSKKRFRCQSLFEKRKSPGVTARTFSESEGGTMNDAES